MSNYTSEKINSKKVRALAGSTTCKVGRWRTIWRDLNMRSIYSTQPYPIMFKNMLKIKTVSNKLFMWPPEVFNDYVWELIGNYFLTSLVNSQHALLIFILFYYEAKRY